MAKINPVMTVVTVAALITAVDRIEGSLKAVSAGLETLPREMAVTVPGDTGDSVSVVQRLQPSDPEKC